MVKLVNFIVNIVSFFMVVGFIIWVSHNFSFSKTMFGEYQISSPFGYVKLYLDSSTITKE